MRADGQPPEAVRAFARAYEALRAGASGALADRDLEPVADVPRAAGLPPSDDAAAALDRVVVIKLNGGLGTSMGLSRAKSLLEAKDGLTFLDIIARQVLALRAEHDARLPLVLMDSFSTRDDSLPRSSATPSSRGDVPPDFLQNKEPKVRVDDLMPVEWPDDPSSSGARPATATSTPRCCSSGMLGRAARARLRVRLRRQLRQPRRGARAAHPRLAARPSGSRS